MIVESVFRPEHGANPEDIARGMTHSHVGYISPHILFRPADWFILSLKAYAAQVILESRPRTGNAIRFRGEQKRRVLP